MARVVYDFYMTQAARALEIACDSRKRKSYRLNRPLRMVLTFVTAHTFCASRDIGFPLGGAY